MFHGDWCSEIHGKESALTADFNVRNICSAVERMDVCEYSLEKIIVPLTECIAETNFFFEVNILMLKELLKQTMDDCKIFLQDKYIIL